MSSSGININNDVQAEYTANLASTCENSIVLYISEEQEFLVKWGCEELLDDFLQKGINVECFKEMTENDIINLIPHEKYGLRIKFRSRLLEWRRANGYSLMSTAETLSINSSTPTWINSSNFSENSPNSPASSVHSLFEIHPTEINVVEIKNKNLEQILEASFIGKSILDISKKNNILSFKSRNDLCEVIAHYWIVNDCQHVLSSQYCREIIDDIIKLFPLKDKENYISSDKKRKGKLAQKYYSLLRKYREKGVIESRYKIKCQKTSENAVITPDTFQVEQDESLVGSQIWLKSNKQPEALVVEKWRDTYSLRMRHIKEDKDLFTEWPILKEQIGISLIELDFDKSYPNKSQCLFSKWDEFKIKIKDFYKKNIKDNTSKQNFQLINNQINTDSEDYILCILLNSILVPSGIHARKNGKNCFWKPSILEGQEFMAIHVETENDIENVVKAHRQKLVDKGLTNQPLIIVVGELTNLKKFFVNLNQFLYKLDSFKKTLSIIIQIFYVLNLKFPCPCKQAYEFIAIYFYDLILDTKKSNQLIQLLAELRN